MSETCDHMQTFLAEKKFVPSCSCSRSRIPHDRGYYYIYIIYYYYYSLRASVSSPTSGSISRIVENAVVFPQWDE